MSKKTFESVCDALEGAGESASLKARADLMNALRDLVERKGWTQAEAGRRCRVTQPRMNDLLRGRISKFSLDALGNMADDPMRALWVHGVGAKKKPDLRCRWGGQSRILTNDQEM